MWAYVQRGRKKLKLSSAHALLPRDFSHGGLRLQLLPALSLDWPCGWTGFGLEFGFGFGGGSWLAPRVRASRKDINFPKVPFQRAKITHGAGQQE